MTSPVVLLTGFEPFENDPVNPSWEGVRALDGELIDGARVVARQLPCVFGRAGEALRAALDELDPVLVIGTGLAGGRMEISVERVAINVDDARIADNAGAQPIDRAIAPDGPAAYFSTLPIKRLVAALRAGGVPAAVSQTAGTFVCNHVFYALMHALAARPDAPPAGFLHVPWLAEHTAVRPGVPTLSHEVLTRGLRLAIAEALKGGDDVRHSGGALH